MQWCIKGMALKGGDDQAKFLIDSRNGILCNWWRDVHQITAPQMRDKLTDGNLNLHVNHFTVITRVPSGRLANLRLSYL